MTTPVVSIIMPTLDRLKYLRQAVASVQLQAYPDWELIVIDDGSTDATADDMQRLMKSDNRIRYKSRLSQPAGSATCRNDGINEARGEYVIFLDSDDCLAPFCLETRLEAMEKYNHYDFLVFPCRLFRYSLGDLRLLWNIPNSKNDIDRYLRMDVPWQTSSPIWKKSSLLRTGLWNPRLKNKDDWDFYLRVLIKGFAYKYMDSAPDCFWRIPTPDRDNLGKNSSKENVLESFEKLYEDVLKNLRNSCLLTDERKQLLGGLYYRIIRKWMEKGHRAKASVLWKHCYGEGLITKRQYMEGLALLTVWQHRLLKNSYARYLGWAWPDELLGGPSETFRKVPYSHL